ncbi:MAG: hypothetical protein FJ109_13550 [Deltaproteobacteria bacterium]|nr:hypothetical protein [Deltaproteobacteria bacterium]
MEEREEPSRRRRPGDLPYRPGNAAPPDRLPAPVILVGIGGFGHDVLARLEADAAAIAEVRGPEAIRNFATLRILTRDELLEARRHGFEPHGELRRGMFFRQEPDSLAAAFQADGPCAEPGFELAAGMPARPPLELLLAQLRELVALLFRSDRFVDFHSDTNRFVSRLDVFVVSQTGHPLGYGAHWAVQETVAALAAGPMRPLFLPHRSNLAINHLVSFPLVRRPDANQQARHLVLRYRAHLHDMEKRLRPVPSKFVFLEDRSAKYVLGQDQVVLLFAGYLKLLAFERTGQAALLRRLIEPIPDIERLRHKGFATDNFCAAFSIASVEAPLHTILRYCRNRQAIAVLNVFLDRAQDGEPPRPEFTEPAFDADERIKRYGSDGTLLNELADCFRKRVLDLEKDRSNRQKERKLTTPWGMADIGEWEYHGNLVEPFHNDLHEKGSPRYTLVWLKQWRDRIVDFLRFLVEHVLRGVFEQVEKAGEEMANRLLSQEREATDSLVASAPAGWKRALKRLDHVLGLLKARREAVSRLVLAKRFASISTREGLKKCRSLFDEFEGATDRKPVRERLLRYANVLGSIIGFATVTLALSWISLHPLLTMGLGLVLGAPAGLAAGRWLARWHNARILKEIGALIAASPDCALQKGLEGACDELYCIDNPRSFVGERVDWTYQMWRLRFFARVVADLEEDIERLRDIGRILDIQLNRFRGDQEAIGVQFHQDGQVLHQDPRRVISSTELFCQAMFSSDRLEGLYAHWALEPDRMAMTYVTEAAPFQAWRTELPFAYYRDLTDFFLVPFHPLDDVDFLSHPETATEATGRVKAFLGDFANKLEVHIQREVDESQPMVREERLVVLHSGLLPALRRFFGELHWPPGWHEVPELPGRNGIFLVRAVDGLAPWELTAMGDQAQMVRDLVCHGLLDALVDVVRRVDGANLKTSMVAVALAELVPGKQENEGWDTYPRKLLEEYQRMRQTGERPLDGNRFVPVDQAAGWVKPLVGLPGLLPLVARLYGTAMDESEHPFEEALRRSRLILLAARGERTFAHKEMAGFPEGWPHPFTASLIHAEAVVDLVLQERLPEAHLLLERLKPDAVRASCLLRAAILLAEKKRQADAASFLDLAFVPEEDGVPPPPIESRPDFESLLHVFGLLQTHPKLAMAMVTVFGGSEFAHLDEAPETERVKWLLQVVENRAPAALLRLLAEFPGAHLDAGLIGRVRRAAL